MFAAVAAVPPQTNYIIETWKAWPQEVSTALNIWRIGFAISVQFFYAGWVKEVGSNWVWGTAADEQAYAPLRGQAARFADARRSLWLVLVDEAFKGRVCDGTPTGG